jgi:phage baseplate assembly protein gpV
VSRVAELMGAFARDQVERRTFCELAVVTSVFDDTSGDDSHTVSVKLKDTGLALRNLPVAAWATGLACLPRVGDVVLVLFPRGSLVSGIVFGQVYSDDRRPPKFAKDEIALIWPEAQEDRAVVRLDGTDDPKVSLAAGGDGEVAIELKKGEIKLAASGIALRLTYSGNSDGAIAVDAGGTKIELKQDGDLTVTAAGKLTLRGTQVSIEADGPVKINGATVDLN